MLLIGASSRRTERCESIHSSRIGPEPAQDDSPVAGLSGCRKMARFTLELRQSKAANPHSVQPHLKEF